MQRARVIPHSPRSAVDDAERGRIRRGHCATGLSQKSRVTDGSGVADPNHG